MASKYRENSDRAIYLTQEIDRQVVAQLTPEIVRLRTRSSEPVFLYIDSLGGSTYFAERLLNLIKTPNQDRESCELMTVGIGIAGSAAADLLALGDYAMVYSGARIYYHGTRQSSEEITVESLQTLAVSLRETNETYALRLAARMFRRLVFLMLALSLESEAEEASFAFARAAGDPSAFFNKLSGKVNEPITKIFSQALERQRKILDLIRDLDLNSHPIAGAGNLDLDSEIKLLKGIVDFEATRMKSASEKSLKPGHLDVIQEDFVQLKDFYSGRFRRELDKLMSERGPSFLTADEETEFRKIPEEKKDEREEFLVGTVGPRLNPLWHLVVCICRILQSAEHSISPRDAYWLGLVDEVVGSKLLCIRQIEEEIERAKEREKATQL